MSLHKPTFLLCPPDYFDVRYAINPWMDPDAWDPEVHNDASHKGWQALVMAIEEAGGQVVTLPAEPGVPDMVFTANCAVVLNGTALLGHYRHPERQREEPFVKACFEKLMAQDVVDELEPCPKGLFFEGAGDAVWDPSRQLMWMGYGPRSDREMDRVVSRMFGVETLSLEMVNPRYYHLDTALSVLSDGEILFIKSAFSAESLECIETTVPREKRIPISDGDALRLAANGVCIGKTLITGGISRFLEALLKERGYRVRHLPLGSFALSGGSAYCLSLRLDNTASGQASVLQAPS